MIAGLTGRIIATDLNRIILDVHGVGYEVLVSFTSLGQMEQAQEIFLNIYTSVRENAIELYGFVEYDERKLFELLIGVSGIGPKSALAILSGSSVDQFTTAVMENNIAKLTTIPGIGKKTAERIILELKEKIKKKFASADTTSSKASFSSLEEDIVASLTSLGFKEKDAVKASNSIFQQYGSQLNLAEAIKLALKYLTA
jgi:holliday junction DNA helicase RuvA